jgi:hypothetical protein
MLSNAPLAPSPPLAVVGGVVGVVGVVVGVVVAVVVFVVVLVVVVSVGGAVVIQGEHGRA